MMFVPWTHINSYQLFPFSPFPGRKPDQPISVYHDREQRSTCDDGIGPDEPIDYENPSTLGFRLIRIIALKQLCGYIEIRSGSGFSCSITFPDNLYNLRINDEE
jgi:two-component sensor histidine kinase